MRALGWVVLAAVLTACGGSYAADDGQGAAKAASPREQRIMIAQQTQKEAMENAPGITGQAPYRFRVKTGAHKIPREAWEDLRKAHGGFAVDHRPGKGEAYFGLPNTGLLRLSADMTTIDILNAAPELRDGGTMHNATIWYADDGEAFLVFPGVDRGAIFTTDLEGKLVNRLPAPTADQMTVEPVKKWFADGQALVPTDVEYLNGLYWVTTGYSALDYVLTARITSTKPFAAEWNAFAFGGKGDANDQFQTGHGITVYPDRTHLVIADRPKSKLKQFTPEGEFVKEYLVPEGALPCDVDYVGGFTLVPCLNGPDRKMGAPIYLVKDDQIVSTIVCKEDLGLIRFDHIHNAVLREVDGRLYIIAQAWNPGDFVVLEQVDE